MFCVFFFQAEDGIRDLVRSRGLGDVYKRQVVTPPVKETTPPVKEAPPVKEQPKAATTAQQGTRCLLYTSDAADERSSVDLGGRRIIKKKNHAADS